VLGAPAAAAAANTSALAAALAAEIADGTVGAGGYAPLRFAHATALALAWVRARVDALCAQGFTVVAWGCASADAALLVAVFEGDAAAAAQAVRACVDGTSGAPAPAPTTFLAGTSAPRLSFATVDALFGTRVAVLALDWAEAGDALAALGGLAAARVGLPIVVPFPRQAVVALDATAAVWDVFTAQRGAWELHSHERRLPPWPLSLRAPARRIVGLMHQFNERMIAPHFLLNAAGKFDEFVVLDYNSTDGSREMAAEIAPPGWQVRLTRNPAFGMQQCDAEVMDEEAAFEGAWRMAFTTTEVLVHADLRGMLRAWEQDTGAWAAAWAGFYPTPRALYFRSIYVSGNDSRPLQRWAPLAQQRSGFLVERSRTVVEELPLLGQDVSVRNIMRRGWSAYSRYMHRFERGEYGYSGGRHFMMSPTFPGWGYFAQLAIQAARSNLSEAYPLVAPRGFIAKYKWAPWPESIDRKEHRVDHTLPGYEMGASDVMDHGAIVAERENLLTWHQEEDLRTAFLAPPAQTHTAPWIGGGMRANHWEWAAVFNAEGAEYVQRGRERAGYVQDAEAEAARAALNLSFSPLCLTRAECLCDDAKAPPPACVT
jgi:hypothetical protein